MTDTNNAAQERTALIESRIDKDRAAAISISGAAGGLSIGDLAQVFEFAKAMSTAGPMIPAFLRNNPGACLGICLQAIEWRMSPFAVANKAYAVEQKGEIRVAFESQLIHAVIEARAPLKGRLNVRYEGEGDERVCIVSCTLKGEDTPREHRSPTLGRRKPGLNQSGARKGSPLWDTKPDVQLFYDTSRDLARILFPDIIMGLYSDDELSEVGYEPVKTVTFRKVDDSQAVTDPANGLHERLSASAIAKAGFDPRRIHAELDGPAIVHTTSGDMVVEDGEEMSPAVRKAMGRFHAKDEQYKEQMLNKDQREAEEASLLAETGSANPPLAESDAGARSPAPEASPVSPILAGDAEGEATGKRQKK
jgi:hypothetical protein